MLDVCWVMGIHAHCFMQERDLATGRKKFRVPPMYLHHASMDAELKKNSVSEDT